MSYSVAIVDEFIVCAEEAMVEARRYGLPLNEVRKFEDAIAAAKNFQNKLRKKK